MVLHLSHDELFFAILMAAVHGIQHLFFRLVPPLIPVLVVNLDSPLWQIGFLVSIYTFAGGLFQAPMGILADRMDRTFILVPSIGFMALGYLVFGFGSLYGEILPTLFVTGYPFTGSYQLMAVGMLIAGLGHSMIHPAGYPLMTANVSPNNKGTMFGIWGSAAKFGDATAPILVGLFILVFAWERIVVGLSMFGLFFALALFGIFRLMDFDTLPPKNDIEGTTETPDWFGDLRVFVLPMGVIMLFFLFIVFAANGLSTFVPVFITDVYGYSFTVFGTNFGTESVANFYFSIMLICGGVSQLVMGSLSDRLDHRLVLIGAMTMTTGGMVALTYLVLSPLPLLFVLALIGTGVFGLNPARDALISDITPKAYEGRIFGYIWTIALVVGSTYPVIIGYLADIVGIRASFSYIALASLLGIGCITLLFSQRIYHSAGSLRIHTR